MPAEDFTGEHDDVFAEAAFIYRKRSQVRGQMWLETPVRRELDMIEEKLRRAEAAYERWVPADDCQHKDALAFKAEFEDSLLDLMNFANFAIKKVRRGQ